MKKLFLTLSLILLTATYSFAAGSSGDTKKKVNKNKYGDEYRVALKYIEKAKKLEKKNKNEKAEKHYKIAIEKLLETNKLIPSNPDVFNYLGFSYRKIGDYKSAEIYYAIGLELDPTHVVINEYMGELYVTTNRMDLAKERLAVLKNCNCEEYNELKAVIDGKKESKY